MLDEIVKTLGKEGGYVNNSRDPGGETNFGISKRAYPNVDIKNLTLRVVRFLSSPAWEDNSFERVICVRLIVF